MSNDERATKFAKLKKIFYKRRKTDDDISMMIDILFATTELKSYTSNLSATRLRSLCEAMKLVHKHAQQYLFHKGDHSDAFYIIISGTVEMI